jgi:hypothetical protein
MLTNVIRQLLETVPFTPFTLSLASRTAMRIALPESATIDETGDVLHVIDTDGRENFVSIRHVACITLDLSPDDAIEIPF